MINLAKCLKSISALVVVGLVSLALPSGAYAAYGGMLHHYKMPWAEHKGYDAATVHVYVHNSSDWDFSGSICATDVKYGRHLGCVPGAHVPAHGNYYFNLTRMFPEAGNHTVAISYQSNGKWMAVKGGSARFGM